MKKLLFILLILGIFSLNLINAEVQVTYNAYYAEIQENGSVTYTQIPVNDFQTLGYVCLNSDCSQVGNKITGLTSSTNTNSITLKFPTALQNTNGYGVWFYKPGYIHWEQKPTWNGTRTVKQNYSIYLLKKQKAWAPIMDLNVTNKVHPNLPIEVGVNVGIDAETYSAIQNAGPLKYNPSELDSLNIVNTKVKLQIKDSSDTIIQEQEKDLSIPYSSFEKVSFNYPGFASTGEYEVKVLTEVNDPKILNSITQSAESNIKVIPQGLTDYSYTLINGLEISPAFPIKNQQVNFSLDYASNYINEFGVSAPLGTNITATIYRGGNNIEQTQYTLPNSLSEFSFNRTFGTTGAYRVVVEGIPSECLGTNPCLSINQELNFIIPEEIPADTIAPIITILSPINNHIYNSSDIEIIVSTNELSQAEFTLNNGNKISLNSADFLNFDYTLQGLSNGNYNLVIYAKDLSNNLASKTIQFIVNKTTDDKDKKKHKSNIADNVIEQEPTSAISKNMLGFEETLPSIIKISLGQKQEDNFRIFFYLLILLLIILILVIVYRLLR